MKEDLVGREATIKLGKKTSNYYSLANLKKVTILKDCGIEYGVGKRKFSVKIVEGFCENKQYYRSYIAGDVVELYEDVLDLHMIGAGYEIF